MDPPDLANWAGITFQITSFRLVPIDRDFGVTSGLT